MSKKSDGIVEFWRSHRDDEESEKEVAASHVDVHAHPAAILELKRILTLHLKLARSAPNVPTSSADDRPTLDNPYTDDYDRDRVFHQDPNKRRYGD